MRADGRYRAAARARPPVPDELLDVDTVLASGRVRVLQAGDRTTIAAVACDGGGARTEALSETTTARVLETPRARLGRDARLARRRAGSAPRASRLRRSSPFSSAGASALPLRSCAVTRWVTGPAARRPLAARDAAARRALTVAFADYLRALHAAGIYPQDLRGANVLVTGEEPPRFVLVDLDRVRRYRRLSWRRRRKNVVQVHRSVGRGASLARERLRFLRRYLGDVRAAAELRARRGPRSLALGRVKDAEYARRRAAAAAERARRSG